MTTKIISTKKISGIKHFASEISFECDNYNVYLNAILFQTNDIINSKNIECSIQKVFPSRIVVGNFVSISMHNLSKMLRHALSHTIRTYIHQESSSIMNLVDINPDTQFINQREEKFWNIISRHFSLPPKHIFEYEPNEEKGAFIAQGTWWEFFVVLCNDNQGVILEGAAYD